MSKYIGKRVSYTCTECGNLFSWNKKSVYAEDKIFCSTECHETNKRLEETEKLVSKLETEWAAA